MKVVALVLVLLINVTFCDVLPADRENLVNLYNALDGDNWTNNANWLVGDPCGNRWAGLYCVGDDILRISFLFEFDLSGTIPSDFTISTLTEFHMVYTYGITGQLPDLNLPLVEYFRIQECNFTGTIPNFSMMPNVNQIDLNGNHFEGTIPDFSMLPLLESLWLDDNRLEGTLPEFSQTFTALKISNNHITGTFPSTIKSTGQLYVINNDLCGNLPETLDLLPSNLVLIGNTFLCPVPEYCLGCTCDDVLGLCCPLGQFFNSGSCEDCDDNCLTCSTSSTTCTSCARPTPFLNGETCEDCTDGKFDNGEECEDCDDSCFTCTTSSTTCTSCAEPNPILDGTSCVSCPEGQYYNGFSCEDCDDNCKTCSELSTKCLSCTSPFPVLNESENICEECPSGKFDNGEGSCEDCAENCVTCTGTATTCTSCTDPTPILEEGTCISCPDGQYSNDGICENCDDNCGTCSGSATNCLSCNSPFPKLNGNSCEECDRGNYDNGSDSCESCNQENCPPFSEPIAETQWSIYKPQCIRWDINTIDQSETVTLSLEYGPDFAREFVIKENIFVTLEQYEWKVVGVLPGSTSRIKMKFNSSGKVRYSETYVIAPPFLPYSNPC